MKFSTVIVAFAANVLAAPSLIARDGGKFGEGQPIDADGKGGPIQGGTDNSIDVANQDNLGRQATDNGVVPNLKWRFSDSKTRILKGGWVREQVVTDLPASHDIAGAQQHLKKGAIRELHWHRTAEWGIIYKGGLIISIVDENGVYQEETLGYGDIWYFPKGTAHTVQGTEEDNEFLLIFDDADFDKVGTTFNIDDWLAHTPKSVLAKNFGVPESVFDKVPAKNPYILPASVAKKNVTGAVTPEASGKNSFVYRTLQHEPEKVGGKGGTFYKIDSTNFPVAKTIAATFVTLKPGALRELHWHPNAEEWLYFHKGKAQATVFIGNTNARTFDFSAGDTAVFPDNAGHYIENTGDEDLVWIEIYKSDRVADIPLSQWLALTPPELVSQTLNVSLEFVEHIKKEKQVFVQ